MPSTVSLAHTKLQAADAVSTPQRASAVSILAAACLALTAGTLAAAGGAGAAVQVSPCQAVAMMGEWGGIRSIRGTKCSI